jgi:hypothetical protein
LEHDEGSAFVGIDGDEGTAHGVGCDGDSGQPADAFDPLVQSVLVHLLAKVIQKQPF